MKRVLATVVAGLILCAGLGISAPQANAAADKGTYGAGHSAVPKASPYITYQYLDHCRTVAGTPYSAIVYKGSVKLHGVLTFSQPFSVLDGIDISFSSRASGTYTDGDWGCHKLSP